MNSADLEPALRRRLRRARRKYKTAASVARKNAPRADGLLPRRLYRAVRQFVAALRAAGRWG